MFDHTRENSTNNVYIVRKTKVLSKIDENGYESQSPLVGASGPAPTLKLVVVSGR